MVKTKKTENRSSSKHSTSLLDEDGSFWLTGRFFEKSSSLRNG